MTTPSDDPQDEFVFDEDFVAAAKFKEPAAPPPPPRTRGIGRLGSWWAGLRGRAVGRRFTGPKPGRPRGSRPATGRFSIGPRPLTVLIVLGVVALALLLNYLDPLGLHSTGR